MGVGAGNEGIGNEGAEERGEIERARRGRGTTARLRGQSASIVRRHAV